MGAYTAWLSGMLVEGTTPCLDVPSCAAGRLLLIADFEPSAVCLQAHLGRLPDVILLPGTPAAPLPQIRYYRYRTATNPIEWDPDVDQEFRLGIDTVAFFTATEPLRGRTCLRLFRLGVRRLIRVTDGKTRATHPLWQAFCCQVATLRQRYGKPAASSAECHAQLAALRPRASGGDAWSERPLRVAHFVNSLNSGGAERQACYTALGQHAAGHDVRLLLRQAPVGHDAHYQFLLKPHGITAERAGTRWRHSFLRGWRQRGLHAGWFHALPEDLRGTVMDLLGDLLARPVDILHAYVDDCNVPAVIAACLAGTPGVILSLRNGNPAHFPGLLRPWMREWYSWAWGRPGVAFVSNSAAGARDYETWLGIPPGSIPVIRNAFYPPPLPEREAVEQWRRDHDIAPGQPVVAGVFRLEPEKRPLYFLDCIQRLRRRVPGLCVLMAGVGSLEPEVRRAIQKNNLGSVVRSLGQREDVPLLLAASDVLLLTSDWEGTPNVVLEAQHCGSVPVVTDAGGSAEALCPGKTGIVVGQDEADAAVAAVAELLADPGRRRRMAAAGRAFVAAEFGPDQLDWATLSLYRETLAHAGTSTPASV